MSVVVAMGKFTPVQTEYAIKDNLPKTTTRVNAHIVVGTPGTMTDLIRRKVIDPSEVKVFVLDEADNMLDQDGLGDQTLRVKKCVYTLCVVCGNDADSYSRSRYPVRCLATPLHRFCFSPPLSQIMFETSPISLRQTRTRLSCRRMNYRSTIFASSTWTARMRSTNTTSWSHCTVC